MTFEQLPLIEPLLRAVKKEGYTTPTPIQAQAIPVILEKKDLLGCAQTGTGKTAAFAIPILQHLYGDGTPSKGYKHIRTLILTPTRELAAQINDSFSAYGRYTGLKHDVIFGGVSQHTQTLALRNGTDVLIATPGRLLDLMNQGYVYLDHLEIFVLDEADRMLDMGFINDIKKIVRHLPQERQTLFFSATMPPDIAKLANSLLHQPVKVEVTPVSSTVEKIDQSIYMVSKADKPSLLLHLLKEKGLTRTLVFTRTKHGADRIVKNLKKQNINADALHGDKTQSARERALANFKSGRLRVLVATDIAARGIDVDNLTHVINFDLPNMPETYVHRIGRTGRAGADGFAFSFCDAEERAYLKDIIKVTARTIPVVEDHPYHMVVRQSAPQAPREQRGGGGGGRNNRSGRSNPQRNDRRKGAPARKPEANQ
ncbi:DEAD/DEAH box helicase [Paraflavisolibacter sp. H34]|uniref:DEAD/DEAH box helicase n=1 Tax=Huijunlia imazamoxiresistens TaxID=3127457 RepID=UPI003018C2AB